LPDRSEGVLRFLAAHALQRVLGFLQALGRAAGSRPGLFRRLRGTLHVLNGLLETVEGLL
jgi:hypothetical protein